jgi:hypothetical protein
MELNMSKSVMKTNVSYFINDKIVLATLALSNESIGKKIARNWDCDLTKKT